jgi:hypothetical protein
LVLVLVEVEVEVEVEEATMTARTKKAKQGLEPEFRKRFGVLPNLGPHSLPSSLSRRSAQLKATNDANVGPRPGRARRRPKMKMRFQDESRL